MTVSFLSRRCAVARTMPNDNNTALLEAVCQQNGRELYVSIILDGITIRCELNINGGTRRILLVAKEEETLEHVALRLAAAILFFDWEPALEAGPKHPAVVDFGFFPDLLVTDEAGAVSIWIECGNIATNKLTKVARRLRGARLVALRESAEDGHRFREVIKKEIPKGEKIEIWAWPKAEFAKWTNALRESSHVYGEASGRSLNLVLNEVPFCVDLISC